MEQSASVGDKGTAALAADGPHCRGDLHGSGWCRCKFRPVAVLEIQAADLANARGHGYASHITIVGGGREAWSVWRLGRWEIVRPRRSRARSSGPSTSLLG